MTFWAHVALLCIVLNQRIDVRITFIPQPYVFSGSHHCKDTIIVKKIIKINFLKKNKQSLEIFPSLSETSRDSFVCTVLQSGQNNVKECLSSKSD